MEAERVRDEIAFLEHDCECWCTIALPFGVRRTIRTSGQNKIIDAFILYPHQLNQNVYTK